MHPSSSPLSGVNKPIVQTAEGLSRPCLPNLVPARAVGWLPGLTYEICQQDGQEEGGGDGGQGGAFPAAVFRRLLQLEGLPGEGIPGQQAGRWRVNGS